MKKLLLAGIAIAAVMNGFAQGTVNFDNSAAGSLTKVYLPDGWTGGSNPGSSGPFAFAKNGNTATDSVPGTQVYTGALLQGFGWIVQLWSAPGSGASEASLVGQTSTTFRTGAAAGRFAFTTATLYNVAPDAAVATLQARVFPTSFISWAAALAAFNSGDPTAILGKSTTFDVQLIGGTVNAPPVMTGLQSFSLGFFVPEPGSLSLAGLVTVFLVLFRRKHPAR